MVEHDLYVPGYLQPVAVHRSDGTRMIARDLDGGWWLWRGDCPAEPLEAIPSSLAGWMVQRLEVEEMPLPRFWFPLAALPMHTEASRHAIVPPVSGD